MNELKQATLILASDVVYDDTLTINFMNTVYKLLTNVDRESQRVERCCLVANERRINFSADRLEAGDTAYDYFIKCLDELNDFVDTDTGYRFKTEQIKIEDSQLIKYIKSYNRNEFLYIWKINSIPI